MNFASQQKRWQPENLKTTIILTTGHTNTNVIPQKMCQNFTVNAQNGCILCPLPPIALAVMPFHAASTDACKAMMIDSCHFWQRQRWHITEK